ncbi:restriction endonuclease subunit S [Clostridium sp. AF37-5]|uniref:restriction endonuclease subunit S n=1 Tax=Clostridium sp. AF37-5 TaxID=2293016 RepID=UPI000E52D46F|nr:restriction endonuclease subunit S [Clostridium sp. AF37-5]RHO96941.1 restriction endonuclease subunit S [Clostridium sp. AF37-5]
MAKLIEITGKALSGEWGIDDQTGEGIPVLRTTNFTNEGVVDYKNVVTRTITKKNIEEKFLRKGDIIIEKSGGSDKFPVGRVIYFEGEDNTYLFNNFTGLLRVKNQEIWYPRYVFYSLFANYRRGGTRMFENKTTGIHNLKLAHYISQYEVNEIVKEEQISVCDKLDKLYVIINEMKQQLRLLDDLIKARFVELFGNPVLNEKGWESNLLAQLTLKIGSGATPKGGREAYQEEGIALIRSMNVYNGKFEYKDLAHISDEQAAKLDNVIIKESDVLLNITGASVARSCVVPNQILPARVNQHVCIIRCKECIEPIFLNRLLIDDNYQKLLWEIAGSGATREAITKQQVERLKIILPPIELQNQFADFVRQVDKSKVAVQKALDETQTLFDSLMQEYFG